MGSVEENTKNSDGRSEVKAGPLKDVVATPAKQPPCSTYELLRQKSLAENLQELQLQGLATNIISPKQKHPTAARLKTPASSPSPLRRSSRKKRKIEFFRNESFSRRGASAEVAKQNQVHKYLKVKLTPLDQTLVDRLAAEVYVRVRTMKLATVDAQKFAETGMGINSAGESVRENKRQQRKKRKIDKALDLYVMTWMPKRTRFKL